MKIIRFDQNTFGSGTRQTLNSDIVAKPKLGSFRLNDSDKLYTNVVGAYSNYFGQRKRINDINSIN